MMMLELGLGEQASKKVHGLRICLWCAFLILFAVDSRRFFFSLGLLIVLLVRFVLFHLCFFIPFGFDGTGSMFITLVFFS
jgi:hypothetical protein